MLRVSLSLACILALCAPTLAKPTPPKKVVLAPITSLGAQQKTKPVETLIEASLSSQGGFHIIGPEIAASTANQQKRPELRSCDGDLSCLSELGTLLAAPLVVHAAVGGLGGSQVVYLKLIDVAAKTEVRSTTLEISNTTEKEKAALAAATRLLAPERYVGTLRLTSSVAKAIVFLDGHKVATTPTNAISVYVGSHALRITHPEHHDFVRFVDVEFDEQMEVEVTLRELPGVSRSLAKKNLLAPSAADVQMVSTKTPWYRRWYTIAGGAIVVGVTTAIIVGVTSRGIDAEEVREL